LITQVNFKAQLCEKKKQNKTKVAHKEKKNPSTNQKAPISIRHIEGDPSY
jgi:hypothetical protein